MDEKITIHVPVQIEEIGGQMVRAKPIGPWRIQSVGTSWKEVRNNLRRQLQKLVPKTLPMHFYEGSLPPTYESWETVVELPPQQPSAAWQTPILVRLQSFRWHLQAGQCVVRIPAVNCTLFGKCEELSPEEVSRQSKVALVRMSEHRDLLQLRERFSERSFDFRSIKLSVPIGVETSNKAEKRQALKKTSTLRSTASDLTVAKLETIFGLDERVKDFAEHFQGETPQSVLIVGPAGVGKSAVVHRLVELRKELGLGDRKIWSTSGSRIVSGMSGLGMWQQRCSKLIRQAHETNAIIHLGSLSELLEAGKIDGQPGVASMIRQAVARGRLLAIAECTPEQLAIVEREDPMLLRAFARFDLKEPDSGKVMEILRAAALEKEATSQVAFSDQALEELTRLHTRFATYSAMPATPLRLMQTIREEASAGETIEADQVARAFAKQTGLPTFLVDDSVSLNLDSIRHTLASHVIGQMEPVQLIVDLIATLKARMVRPGRPLASLMFIGPTGVGKTEMAKAIAPLISSDTRRMIRIDMSEYASPWSIAKLIGKPGEGDGALTSPIREQPFSVVLLDEFEKADPNVFDMLLQLLGEGRLTDSRGRLADFRNAVVIMTSNLGAETFREGNFGFGDSESVGWREHFEREVRRFVRPEFLGRIDRIVPFQPLPKESVRRIAMRELDLLRQRTGFKYADSQVEFSPEAVDLLCEVGYQPKYGARPLRRAIEQLVTVPLADALSDLSEDSSWTFRVRRAETGLQIEAEGRSTKTKSIKEREAEIINAWQELGSMARTAMKCAPLRDLENEMERNIRRNGITSRKLKAAEGPGRVAAMKEQLRMGQQHVATAKRLLTNLADRVDKINHTQLELMLKWHRNEAIDWEHYRSEATAMKAALRHVVENVVRGQLTSGNSQTIVVTGKSGPHLRALWEAYCQLASRHQWSATSYRLTTYDPLQNPESPEYRKRVSEKKAPTTAARGPSLHLLKESNEQDMLTRVADAYLHDGAADFDLASPSIIGFAIQVVGESVAAWLGDEFGVVHVFDANAAGARRRTRYRVDVTANRLSSLLMPSDWPEPIGTPERDPRKMISTATNEIGGIQGASVTFAQGKLVDGLVELMTIEHEQALWKAIGHVGIPPEALLLNYQMVVTN